MNLTKKALLAVAAGVFTFAAQAQAQAPTDPQIVGIVVAANQIDIDAGHLALSKSHNKQVREFAQNMVTDHAAVLKAVFALGAKLHVTPADSATEDSLKKQAAETAAHLKTLHGKAFDKAYIDNEVAYHKAVINAVTTVLVPNAQNAELKSTIISVEPLFTGHLEHAEHLQAEFAAKK